MNVRARVVASANWPELLEAFESHGGGGSSSTELSEWTFRSFKSYAMAIDGLDDRDFMQRRLREAGVPCWLAGESLVLVHRLPSFGRAPWTERAPEVYEAVEDALTAFEAPPPNLLWGGRALPLSTRTHLMGIVNVTPDSFSDGGRWLDPHAAVEHALELTSEGADLLDIGGESTRPGADPVPVAEEIRRVVPVIDALVTARCAAPISIDTTKAEVARAALDAGAEIVNDVSAGRADPAMLPLVAERGVPIVLMHMRGEPRTMQDRPVYRHVVAEVHEFLADRAEAAKQAGVAPGRIVIDPGFGFGKTREHNLVLLRRLRSFTCLGYPVLAGTSRKSFIGATLDVPVGERLEGTAATVALAVLNRAAIVRVHDVAAMRRVTSMVEAVLRATDPSDTKQE